MTRTPSSREASPHGETPPDGGIPPDGETPPRAEPTLPAVLRGLRATPPAGFSQRVLARLGLPVTHDELVLLEGPTGGLFVAFNARGICHVLAAEVVDGDVGAFEARHRARFGRPARPASHPPAGLVEALRSGEARGLAYDLGDLSEFEQAVLRKALEIPRGELRPYAWLAREIGRPKAVRAVGSALGHNPVPVLIPCHRVVRSDGQIGEYVFGSSMKRALLHAEAVDVEEIERLARAGVRLLGDDTTHTFCLPTCRHVAHLTGRHRIQFHSAGQAAKAGYQPCTDCRPQTPRTA